MLKEQAALGIRLVTKRPGVLQVYMPFYHEDGDMLDIFIVEDESGIRVCDFGKTLMRLSYTFDLDTDNKLRIFRELLTQNQVEFDESKGNIYLDTSPQNLFPSLMHLSQVIAKVTRIDVLKREVISSLFFEMVDEYITVNLQEFNPVLREIPIPDRDDLEVTCAFHIKPHPVYLMAVRNVSQARLATIAFLEFQKSKMRFIGFVVHDNFESISAKDRTRLTSAADKQFVSLDDFRENGRSVLLRAVA